MSETESSFEVDWTGAFDDFAKYAEEIEQTSSDGAIKNLVADLLSDAATTDDATLRATARFVQGQVFPAWTDRKLGIGSANCREAIARAAANDVTDDDIEQQEAEVGDLGSVAASLEFGEQQSLGSFGDGTDTLTITDVEETFEEIAQLEGSGSRDAKIDLLFGAFTNCTPRGAQYLARIALNTMRIGVGGGTVRDAIATAFDVDVDNVSRGLQFRNDYGEVAEIAHRDSDKGLEELDMTLGRAIQPQLAQKSEEPQDALDDWGEAAVETKLDGSRIQAHYNGDHARLFTRKMVEVTTQLPEVVEEVENNLDTPAILDGEAIAVDDDGNPREFQQVSRRLRRKHNIDEVKEEVPLVFYAFDVLYHDGSLLLDRPLRERRERLDDCYDGYRSNYVLTSDIDEINRMEVDSLAAGHEGIMLKDPDSAFTPGRRGKEWRKLKPDVETLDLVVIGGEWGEGERANNIGTFLLGARTEDGFETTGKVATGFTEKELDAITERLKPHIATEDGREIRFDAEVVIEVGYEEIQESPDYETGFAFRFPRFIGIREDKSPDDADTTERIERLYEQQG